MKYLCLFIVILSQFAHGQSPSEREQILIELKALENNPIMISIANSASKITATKTSYLCWTAVNKQHLRPLGLVDNRTDPTKFYAGKARDAHRELEDQGFINLMAPGEIFENLNDICIVPAGAILVYDSAIPNHKYGNYGHVETKIGKIGSGEVSSDFRNSRPVTGSCAVSGRYFRLKAVMVPELVLP